ncbi:hypothetical protein LINPERPRIM_LOCUS34110 [Linum perenne]
MEGLSKPSQSISASVQLLERNLEHGC